MINVAIVAFEGISLFHLSVPIAIFNDAVLNDDPLFNVHVCAESTEHLHSANGLGIDVSSDFSVIAQADVVIVPSWIPTQKPSDYFISQLINAYKNNALIVGLCLGAYAIGYCGLLDGKKATTHWKYGDDFANKFPAALTNINSLYIIEENVITSAGSAAAIDCCLHIVKVLYGVKIANKIARVMVSSPERSGGQNQYIESPIIERPKDERIAKLIDHVTANITDTYTLAEAAKYCLMSVRSFSRNFKAANGISFTTWLINTRLNFSVELLETSQCSMSEIAEKTGFSSEQIYRKHFIEKFDCSPKAWQKMFKNN